MMLDFHDYEYLGAPCNTIKCVYDTFGNDLGYRDITQSGLRDRKYTNTIYLRSNSAKY